MLMLVALGVMSVTWMSVIAVIVLAPSSVPDSRHRCETSSRGPGHAVVTTDQKGEEG